MEMEINMAKVFNWFLDFMRLNDEEDEEDYNDDFEEIDEAPQKRIPRFSSRNAEEKEVPEKAERVAPKNADAPIPLRERATRMERTTNNKIVPIRTTPKGMEVCIMKPTAFGDSQDICDMLLTGRAAVVNLEGFDPEEAQRIMDFISGCVYAINGKLHQISRYIFIFSPDTIDVSGDYADLIPEMGFDVPNLNKEF